MLHWIRTRSRRDLVLALVVAGAFFMGVSWFLARSVHRVGHVVVHEDRHEHEHRYEHRAEGADGGGTVFDQSFDLGAEGLLEVRVGEVDVAVSEASGSARVILRVDDHEASADVLDELGFEVEVSDGVLSIRTEARDDWSWRGDRDHDDYDVSLEVTVPRGFGVSVWTGDGDVAIGSFAGEVHVQTGDGDVAIGRAGGPVLRVQTGDGDIALAGAVSREVRIQTGDGDVAVAELAADEVSVRTGDGDIYIQDLAGRLEASTGDGDVQVTVTRFAGIEVRSGDGDITLYVPAGIAADVELNGSEFFVDPAFALTARVDDRRISGQLNGGGAELSIRVGDGTIRLNER